VDWYRGQSLAIRVLVLMAALIVIAFALQQLVS
jgi:hypothetical protein